jgi:hypothetical protein
MNDVVFVVESRGSRVTFSISVLETITMYENGRYGMVLDV